MPQVRSRNGVGRQALKRLALLLLLASPAFGQTIEVKAGDSTLYNAAGASAVLYLPGAELTVGAGTSSGHLVAGAQAKFNWHGWDAVAGDSQLFLTTGQAGLAEPIRGFALSKKSSTSSFAAFAGLSGQVYSAPYFSGTQAKTPAAGIQFARILPHGFAFSTVEAISGSKKTSLAEADYLWRAVKVTGTGGVLENRKFFNGLAQGSWRHFGASLGHSDYFYKGDRSTVNSEGIALAAGPLFGNASAFQSRLAAGQAVSVGVRAGAVQIQGQELFSKYGRTTMASVTEQVSRHFRVSQYITRSRGQTALNFGGGWASNRASVDVSYAQEFLPFGNVPFAKALVVQFSFRVRSATVNLGTLTDPNGKTRFTAYGNSFIQTGIATTQGPQGRRVGAYSVRGRVVDEQGAPVAGAAVRLGKDTVWSDEKGEFSVTQRKAETLSVSLVPDEFTAPGVWVCVSCPATSSELTEIVVRRM